MIVAALYLTGSVLFLAATLVFLYVSHRNRRLLAGLAKEDRGILERRVAWLEERYGLDTHEIFIEGTAIPVKDPMQDRPVQRG